MGAVGISYGRAEPGKACGFPRPGLCCAAEGRVLQMGAQRRDFGGTRCASAVQQRGVLQERG